MKKKILIILGIFSLLAVIGGASLILTVERSASNFDTLIMLHQVEILREHLLLNIYRVQDDLYSQNTTHPESIDSIVNHVGDMEHTIDSCFDCHHVPEVKERLLDLHNQIDQYGHALNRVLTLQEEPPLLRAEQERAHLVGESLINKVNTLIVLTNKRLNERTEDSLRDLHRTKIIAVMLVAAGPLLIAVLGFAAVGSITKPIQTLLQATKRLKAGDLDHRIEGLKDEFAELADAFDDMAGSLKATMRAIEESERRYRLLFESAADAIFILDAEGERAGRIVMANQAAASMHGYTVEELESMRVQDIDSPEASADAQARIERMLKGEWIKVELNHQKKDGTAFPVEISAGAFEFGGHRYILAMDRDISERKQTEEALQRAEAIKTAGELATGLAHEIKNPLAGIKISMEALSEEPNLSDGDRDVLGKVIGEIKRIEFLIKGLLNFTRPPKLQLMNTDVNAVLETVASLALKNQPRSREQGAPPIRVVKELEEDLPRILADPMQLQQVFMNLILNAVDAMPEGGTVVLKTSFDEESKSLRIDISDTGKGIDATVMKRIFQPFFTTKSKGTGLGLAITKRLVEEHGGSIRIESRDGGGTMFRIVLPAVRSERAQPV